MFMKGNKKILLSAAISLSLLVGVIANCGVYVSAAIDITNEVLSFDFSDGNKAPSYAYGGNTYTATNKNSLWITGINDDIWGKTADKSLCLYCNSTTSSTEPYFYVPNPSGQLTDIGNGIAVLSWDMAMKNDGCRQYLYVYYTKKNSSGDYGQNTLTLQFDSNGLLVNTANGVDKYVTSEPTPREEWHSYEIIFEYGKSSLSINRDGLSLAKLNGDSVFGTGYTFSGLGQNTSGNLFAFRLKRGTENGSQYSTGYVDNIKLAKGIVYDETLQRISEFDNIDLLGCNSYSLNKKFWESGSKTSINMSTGQISVAKGGNLITKHFIFDKSFVIDMKLYATDLTGKSAMLILQDDSDNSLILARFFGSRIDYLPNNGKVSDNATDGNISMLIDPQNKTLKIYNNDVLKASSDSALANINLNGAAICISAESSPIVCDKFVLAADCSIYSDFKIFAPRFKYNGLQNILTEAVVMNNSQTEQGVDLFLAKYADEGIADLDCNNDGSTVAANGIKHISGNRSISDLSESNTLSMLLWKNGQIRPVTKKVDFRDDKGYSSPSVPTYEEIAANLNKTHPRLLLTGFDTLVYNVNNNTVYKNWYANVRTAANNAHYASIPVYEDTDSLRIVSSADFRERVMVMSFAYNINPANNTKYAERVWEYLVAAEQWPDWGYGHFLDTADMMMGYAFAYDWLYSYWNAEQKAFIKNTLKTKGLQYAYGSYNGDDYTYWLDYNNNWSTWCNSAVLTAALAIADEDETVIPLIRCAMENIQSCYECFSPDGAWKEGTGYGEAGLGFLAIALSSCETALCSDFGHRYAQGLSDAGFYNLYMYGKDSPLVLNDNSGKNKPYYNFYFGKLFDNKYLNGFRYYQLQTLKLQATLFDLIWYDKNNISLKFRTDMPYDIYYPGIQTVTMKDGFFAGASCFAALHAGYNNVSHGHIDGGTFEYETDGVRWAIDLGSDNYNLFNISQKHEDVAKNRWCYYRCRAEGHNTWVINPDAAADQNIEGEGRITKYELENSGTSWAVADLSDFYSSKVTNMNRGIMLNKTNGSMILRDEISLKSNSELYWFMHTKASISISSDKKSAILTQTDSDGVERRLWVGITEGNGQFVAMSATPLSTSPNPDTWSENINHSGDENNPKTQSANTGVQKLAIHYTNASSVNQTVYMIRLEAGENSPGTIPQNIRLTDWSE